MSDSRWWRFWDIEEWREWRRRRDVWSEYKGTSKPLGFGSVEVSPPAPPRPVSPGWVPFSLVFVLVGLTVAGSPDEPAREVMAATTTSPSTTTSIVTRATGSTADPAPPPMGSHAATVRRIVDGDTIEVTLANGVENDVRLIGINTPERGECFADEASRMLASLIPVGAPITLTTDVSDRDPFDRLLRYVWVGELSVNEEMVRRGAAIARRYPPDTGLTEQLEQAQAEAERLALGLWAADACGLAAETSVRVVDVVYDAPGDDSVNLNEEWVTIRNDGTGVVDLTGWGIKDESASNRYQFPDSFSIAPQETVTIRSGCGDDYDTELFWCSVDTAVWNNDGDTVFLLEPNGNTHHSFGY